RLNVRGKARGHRSSGTVTKLRRAQTLRWDDADWRPHDDADRRTAEEANPSRKDSARSNERHRRHGAANGSGDSKRAHLEREETVGTARAFGEYHQRPARSYRCHN